MLAQATRAIEAILRAVVVGLLAAYLVLILLQVLFRYALGEPIFWAEEIVRYGFVWSIMLASGLVARENGHLRLEGLQYWLPAPAARVVSAIADALTLVFLVALAVGGVDFVTRTLGQTSASLEWPIWVVYAAIPVGAAIEFCLTWSRFGETPDVTDGAQT